MSYLLHLNRNTFASVNRDVESATNAESQIIERFVSELRRHSYKTQNTFTY